MVRASKDFPPDSEPIIHLFQNNRDGTFTDVTVKAGVVHTGWGQGCLRRRLRQRRLGRSVRHLLRQQRALSQQWRRHVHRCERRKRASPATAKRWNTGCAFVDYDRDGHLDLFVANYIDIDLATAPVPESGPCLYKSVMVACGPPGLQGGKNILYHNNGDGTFTDVSETSGILSANGTYGLAFSRADFDNDGWPDIYVANDSTASALYHNKKNGKFEDIAIEAGCALSPDGKPQAGMGVSAADYDMDGNLDIVKTNFAGDTPSLYHNLGGASFEDTTFTAGLGAHTQFPGMGLRLLRHGQRRMARHSDLQRPCLSGSRTTQDRSRIRAAQAALSEPAERAFRRHLNSSGLGYLRAVASRGAAFGDFDNDGDVDIVVNTVNDFPQLLRCDSKLGNNWIKVRTIGTKSNRSGIGARLTCVTQVPGEAKPHRQIDEVRSGGGYFSQNDLRVHFGLGKAEKVDSLEIRWPSGQVDTLKDIKVNQLIYVKEGEGISRTMTFPTNSKNAK